MGAAGCRFGRNVPLEHTFPDTPNLLVPNPRVVSRELMTRDAVPAGDDPQPAGRVVDSVHGARLVRAQAIDDRRRSRSRLPPGDDWGAPTIRVPRVGARARAGRIDAAAGLREPEQPLVGCVADLRLRRGDRGQAAHRRSAASCASSRPGCCRSIPRPACTLTGFTDNWWIGLAMLHTLFTLEHNHICDLLAHEHPDWNDEQLFARRKLINSALMAKIHTVEWTPAIMPHPVIQTAMNVNWSGLAGEDLQDSLEFLERQRAARRHRRLDSRSSRGAVLADRGVRRGLPHAPADARRLRVPLAGDRPAARETRTLHEIAGERTPAIAERVTDARSVLLVRHLSIPGAITLHNYPRHLQNLTRDNGEHLDLAAVDIFRDRERGVPRYNQFRRLLHKEPVKSFDELTDNPAWRKQIKTVYNGDLEKVDLMTGLYRRAAAGGLRLQRDGVPRLHPDGVAPPEERSVLHRRFPARDLHRVRHRLPQEELDASRPAAPLSAARAGAGGGDQCVRTVEDADRAAGRSCVGGGEGGAGGA